LHHKKLLKSTDNWVGPTPDHTLCQHTSGAAPCQAPLALQSVVSMTGTCWTILFQDHH
jgi:hypothetical protein